MWMVAHSKTFSSPDLCLQLIGRSRFYIEAQQMQILQTQLKEYDFIIGHQAGKKNENADALSRRHYCQTQQVLDVVEMPADNSTVFTTVSSESARCLLQPQHIPEHLSVTFTQVQKKPVVAMSETENDIQVKDKQRQCPDFQVIYTYKEKCEIAADYRESQTKFCSSILLLMVLFIISAK